MVYRDSRMLGLQKLSSPAWWSAVLTVTLCKFLWPWPFWKLMGELETMCFVVDQHCQKHSPVLFLLPCTVIHFFLFLHVFCILFFILSVSFIFFFHILLCILFDDGWSCVLQIVSVLCVSFRHLDWLIYFLLPHSPVYFLWWWLISCPSDCFCLVRVISTFGLTHLFSSATFSCVFCLVMVDLMSFRLFLSCACHLDWLWLQVVSADPPAGEGKFNFCLALNMLCFMSRKQKVGLYFAKFKVEMNHVMQVEFFSSVLRLLCFISLSNP